MPTMKRQQEFLLILIIIVGFGLRLAYIDRTMRFDESQTVVLYAIHNIPRIVADYNAPNNHIFHSILVHFVYHYLGIIPIFVRLPALVASILLIPLTYIVTNRWYHRHAGLIAAALVAGLPIMINFGINARGYTLQAMFVLLLIYLGQKLQRHDSTPQWLLMGLLAALGFFTIPTMLYAMGGIALWLLISIWRHNQGEERQLLLKNFVVSMVLGAILTLLFYTPVFIFSGIESLTSNVNVLPVSPAEYYSNLDDLGATFWNHFMWAIPPMIAILLVICFLAGLVVYHRQGHDDLPLLPFMAIWIFAVLMIQRVYPFERTWLFLTPVVCMVTAGGLTGLLEQVKLNRVAVLIPVLAVFFTGFVVYYEQTQVIRTAHHTAYVPDAERAAFVLDERLTSNDRLFLQVPNTYSVYYYGLINDMRFAKVLLGLEESLNRPSDSAGYVYFFYHYGMTRGDHLDREFAETVGDLADAEILYEWDASALGRVPVTGDEPSTVGG